jgi:type IV pilus assembly protein PilC
MEYVCKVGTGSGEVLEKTFTADDEGSLRRELQQQGYFVFSVRSGLQGFQFGFFRSPKVAPALLFIFCQELAALLKAGLPLLQALDITLERQRDPLFRNSLNAIRDRVKSGTSISDAFLEEGEKYPPMLAASLLAGERSGSLELALRRLVQHLRLSQSLRKKVIVASIYPLALVTFMVALMAILVIWVIPQFEGFYEGLHAEMPLLTRGLFFVSKVVSNYLAWILGALVVTALVVGAVLRRPASRILIDRALLRFPYLGHLMRMYATAQLARTLATLLSGGLPLLSALDVAASSIGNRAMATAVREATPLIREGRSLTTTLESTKIVDNLALEMVKVGEQTGALSDMLNALAEFLDEELDTRVATLMTLMEPLMLACMAVVVGVMVLAFYLPLFESFAVIEAGR